MRKKQLISCFCMICHENCAKCSGKQNKRQLGKFFKSLGSHCYSKEEGRSLSAADKKMIWRLIDEKILGICKSCLKKVEEFCELYDEFKKDAEGDVFPVNWKMWIIQSKMEKVCKNYYHWGKIKAILEKNDETQAEYGVSDDEDEDVSNETGATFKKLKIFMNGMIERCSNKIFQCGPKISLTNCLLTPAGSHGINQEGADKRLKLNKVKERGEDGGFKCPSCGKICKTSAGLKGHMTRMGCRPLVQNRIFKPYKSRRVNCHVCGSSFPTKSDTLLHQISSKGACRFQAKGERGKARNPKYKKPIPAQINEVEASVLTLREVDGSMSTLLVDETLPNLEPNQPLGQRIETEPLDEEITQAKFKCRTCGEPFNDFEAWIAHMRAGHPAPMPICDECGECCYQSRADWIFDVKRCTLD